jgi:hypothetical protein
MDSVPRDCPECRSAGSVEHAVCQVCLAELDEGPGSRRDRPLAPRPLRFEDVLSELRLIAELSEGTPGIGGSVADACHRAESLLRAIRWQFLDDVAGPDVNGPGSREETLTDRKAVILS